MFKAIFSIVCILNVFSIAQTTTLNNSVLLRYQRSDSCVSQNSIKVFTTAINTLSVFQRNFKVFVQAISSIGNIAGPFFGFDTRPTCELNSKLNEILQKLNEISNDLEKIKNFVQCMFKKEKFEHLSRSLSNLLNHISQAVKASNKIASRKKVISVCNDNTMGISIMYTDLKILLEEKTVLSYFKNCAQYKTQSVNEWVHTIGRLSVLFVTLLKGCEEAYGVRTEFSYEEFKHKLEYNIDYYTNRLLLKSFSEDSGYSGLQGSIQRVMEENLSAQKSAEKLKDLYNYYDWQVIFYPKVVGTFASHCVSTGSSNHYCGSKFFKRNLKGARNAIVAWCIPHSFSLDISHNDFHQYKYKNAQELHNDIVAKISNGFNYLAVIRYDFDYFEFHYTTRTFLRPYYAGYPDSYFYGPYTRREYSYHDKVTYKFVVFGSAEVKYTNEISIDSFHDDAIHFPEPRSVWDGHIHVPCDCPCQWAETTGNTKMEEYLKSCFSNDSKLFHPKNTYRCYVKEKCRDQPELTETINHI